ncbi:MFS transporter [Ligilactobacillus murinus]|uniref:MFS transporter n=1 Tax=Ligilactobacillus murinus TaxID=1622 RepID=A0AAE6WFT4_9LACO|nr:MFS transporter [Ligilactobacillus murinus]NEF83734.1 MFS transporter [Ligilactobacillus murinus]NEF86060.1 MFS transporter [Ligilactobacillus murinus]NEF88304.1 MFS transporter [Ligilactobacillus murinus]NEF90579.1 MFS transporter [Ligilactobacillus murinus]NEF92890.1 MFS transporter [Ligilactobacillus murinus]
MTFLSKYPKNFKKLLLSGASDNIGDSFYNVALLLGLVEVYHIKADALSLFALLGMIPSMFAFLYSPLLAKIKRTKEWLFIFRTLYLVLVVLVIISFYYKVAIGYIYVYNILFSMISCIQGALQMRLVPEALENDSELIERSVDIQYFTGNTLDILSNFVASLVLGLMSYLGLLQLSLPFLVLGIIFIVQLKTSRALLQPTTEKLPPLKSLVGYISKFFKQKQASQIIVIEAFLSGALDLLVTLAPLYLISLHIDVKWLGLVIAVQQAADFTGALLAPYISLEHHRFFCIDYIFSGTAFLLLFLVPQLYLKLILLFLGFVLIGISGNIFEKMIYKEYRQLDFSIVSTLITSLYSFFGIIFLLLPQVYSNIIVLGIVLNILTLLFGIAIYHQRPNS